MTTDECPEAESHGNPFRYCPVKGCGWMEPQEEKPKPAREVELERRVAELERENDDFHFDLIRVMYERRAAEDEAAWLRAKLSESGVGE